MNLKPNMLSRGLVAGLATLLFVSAPAASLAAAPAAEDEKSDITLHGTAYSSWDLTTVGNVYVDGHLARAIDRLANGSRIVVGDKASAQAEIKSVGRLSIASGSELVVSMETNTVVARMLRGSMAVEVAAKFGAYVETPDSIAIAHPGAYTSFRIAASPLGSRLERSHGDVELVAAVAADDDWEIDAHDSDDEINMGARKTEKLEVKVKRDGNSVNNQPINFAITGALDGATGTFPNGAQRVTVQTDSDGVAAVEFESGASSGQVYIEASIPGTEAHETLHVMVHAKEKTFWNKYTTSLYVAMAAGAVAGTVLAIKNAGDDDEQGGIRPGNPQFPPN
jgi:hypothetical protein